MVLIYFYFIENNDDVLIRILNMSCITLLSII